MYISLFGYREILTTDSVYLSELPGVYNLLRGRNWIFHSLQFSGKYVNHLLYERELCVVSCVTGLLCTSKWHHGLFPSFPSFPYRGCSVGELPRTSTLCLTTDGSSRKCRLGSDVEIPVWRYPVGGKTRVLHRSRGATFCYYGMGYLFCFILWYM